MSKFDFVKKNNRIKYNQQLVEQVNNMCFERVCKTKYKYATIDIMKRFIRVPGFENRYMFDPLEQRVYYFVDRMKYANYVAVQKVILGEDYTQAFVLKTIDNKKKYISVDSMINMCLSTSKDKH